MVFIMRSNSSEPLLLSSDDDEIHSQHFLLFASQKFTFVLWPGLWFVGVLELAALLL